MSFIFDLLKNVFLRMLQILWFNKKKITNKLSIFIKTNTGNTLVVDLDPKWDIKNVKEIVATKTGIPSDDLKIILAGKELKNSTVIEECDLGQQSILHAVRTPKRLIGNKDDTIRESFSEIEPEEEGSKPLNETLQDLSMDDSLEEDSKTDGHRAHFYIYCSKPCKSVQFGKLRVRCATCDSGAVTVDRDPQCWPDVLLPSRITVHCENTNCPTVLNENESQINFARFYFKCSNHASLGEKDEAVPLYLIKSNLDKIPCLACTEISDTILVFQCDIGHVTCLDCFRNYCLVRLKERQFLFDEKSGYYSLACPMGCENSFVQEVHHFRLLADSDYNRYQRFGTEEYVLQSGGILCPQPDCGMGIILDSDKDVEKCRKVTCIGGCGYVFCKNCLQGYHVGECDDPPEIQSTSSGINIYSLTKDGKRDEASKKAIQIMTKPCPQCRTPTEKYGGCMHMICTRGGCGYQWCWVCQTEWTRSCMGNHWFG